MPKKVVALPRSVGMEIDIASHGRRGVVQPQRTDLAQDEKVRRAWTRVPEVVVKVSGGARDIEGAKAHLMYIGRQGRLHIETDDDQLLRGRGAIDRLIAEWQLDLCSCVYKPLPSKGRKDARARLLHHIALSMPADTPPLKVLKAARTFARENFSFQYRYALVLHTDQAHPHVHLAVKCESECEPGQRLWIRKAMLREWREQFAELLRAEGVAAIATPRRGRPPVARPLRHSAHHRRPASPAIIPSSCEQQWAGYLPERVPALRVRIGEAGKSLRAQVSGGKSRDVHSQEGSSSRLSRAR